MMIRADIFRISLRQLVGAHRIGMTLFLLFCALLPVMIAASVMQVHQAEGTYVNHDEFLSVLFTGFQLTLLFPIITLILVSLVLREEISNNTIVYLWTKPISRASILLSKYLSAIVIALLLASVSVLGTASMLTTNSNVIFDQLLTAWVAVLAYGAFFLALSLYFGRAILIGFFYILVWEVLFSRVAPLASQLSIRHYAENLSSSLQSGTGELSMTASLVVLLIILMGFMAISIRRFTQMEFPGETD